MELMRKIALGIILLAFLTAAYFYPQMPERMASHWDASGEVNGYMGKDIGLFLMPFLSLALFGLFIALPKLDPMRENYRYFMREYEGMIALVTAFLYYIYVLTLLYNLGYAFDMTRLLAPAFGVFIMYMGIVVSKAKRNWFVGIRTPWTLSSDVVWDKTHKVCSGLFRASGIVAFIGTAYRPALMVSVAMLVATAVFAVVYSYLEFRRETKGAKRPAGGKRRGKRKPPEK